MGLSNCPRCWDNPCSCGYEFRYHGKKDRLQIAAGILGMSVGELSTAIDVLVPETHPALDAEQRASNPVKG